MTRIRLEPWLADSWSWCEPLAVGPWREGLAVVVQLLKSADLPDRCFLEEIPHAHAGDAVDDVSACLGPVFLNRDASGFPEPTVWRLIRRLARTADIPAANQLSPDAPPLVLGWAS